MPQSLDESQVRNVAKLARLKLDDDQIKTYTRQLSSILGYIEKLSELNTDNVEPMAHVAPLRNVLREDVARPGMGVKRVLQNAPDADENFFLVPKVLEDSSGT